MSIYCKVFLLSLILSNILYFTLKLMLKLMNDEKQGKAFISDEYPKRIIFLALTWAASVMELVIVLIIWIIKA